MKPIAVFLVICALVSGALAGPTYTTGKGAKSVNIPPSLGCDCFQPGAALGIYGGGILDEDDALGGVALGEYFFTQYLGFQLSYGVFATESAHHEIDGAFLLRYPIPSACIAPYLMVGGGLGLN